MRPQIDSSLLASEQAVTSIEYALVAALIAMTVLGSVKLVGDRTEDIWALVAMRVSEAVASGNRP